MRNSSQVFRLLIPAGVIWVILSGLELISFSPCPFHLLTGLPCPSCGPTRAILGLFEAAGADSIRINPLGLVCVGGLAAGLLLTLIERTTRKPIMQPLADRCILFIQHKSVAAPLILLVLANWFWNISKGL
ncbi:MAG: DUF2752 domain-containing protein [Bacteroidota bacterium]